MSTRSVRNHPYRRHRRITSGNGYQNLLARRRRQPAAMQTPLVEPDLDPGGCIDLTANDTLDEDVIDLTDTTVTTSIDSPIVVISSLDVDNADNHFRFSSPGRRLRPTQLEFDEVIDLEREPPISADLQLRTIRNHSTIDVDSLSDDDLPDPPFDVRPSASGSNVVSPESVKISCPICLDSKAQIYHGGRQLYSTLCGHIFCSTCIKHSINTQHKCPSCRKKLTNRQIHPVYI